MNAHRRANNPAGKAFAMSETGVHVADPVDVPAASAGHVGKA